MVCTHLKELYALCEKNQLRIGSSDLVRVVCKQCQQEDTCPSLLMEQHESSQQDHASSARRSPQTLSENED